MSLWNYPKQNFNEPMDAKSPEEITKNDFEYFKENKPEVFVLLSGFTEKTNVIQIINFLKGDLTCSPVEDGVYGILFLTTADGCSTGKAVVRLKSVNLIEDILKKQGKRLNKKPIAIKPISKNEGLAILYSTKNKIDKYDNYNLPL
ncbi:unnamed protein product [Brassicogethes aeneus]|uniref:Uncharacterized protein n=1 Tax=Brassicogethes aeneus TaxID=1431903 RepID=A0A9P0FC18_BRAAE|nr:unnamed protein product [Brassicogethes aeneus]